MQLAQHTTAVVAGIALAHPTAGATIVGSAYAARRASITSQQIDLIEGECRRRQVSSPRVKTRDLVTGAAIGAGVAALGGLTGVAHDFAGSAIASGATAHLGSQIAGHHLQV